MIALNRCDFYGLCHATAEGSCSWHEFARDIRVGGKTVRPLPALAFGRRRIVWVVI
jgi:hypothetical protein